MKLTLYCRESWNWKALVVGELSPVLDPYWSKRHGLEYIPQLNNYEENEITYQGGALTTEQGETSVSIF